MSKPIKHDGDYFCPKCGYAVTHKMVYCEWCNKVKLDWHPSYKKEGGCWWEVRHNDVMRKITEAEYIAGLKSEEVYYND